MSYSGCGLTLPDVRTSIEAHLGVGLTRGERGSALSEERACGI